MSTEQGSKTPSNALDDAFDEMWETDERIRRIERAFDFVPLNQYDEVTKLAVDALVSLARQASQSITATPQPSSQTDGEG